MALAAGASMRLTEAPGPAAFRSLIRVGLKEAVSGLSGDCTTAFAMPVK